MKTIRSVLGTAVVVASAACAGSTEPEVELANSALDAEGSLVMAVGDHVRVRGTTLWVTFLGLESDSRCPVDVTCVWAGDAEVELALVVGTGPSVPSVLHWNTQMGPASAEAGPYRVSLVAIEPVARSDRVIREDEYRVRLTVEVR
jgi:hypothetical protein